jgi:hypothetical protein
VEGMVLSAFFHAGLSPSVSSPDGPHPRDVSCARRLGRATSSPPQFGQICSIPSAQFAQNVHS